MKRIFVEPEDLWDFFSEHDGDFIIASDEEFGINFFLNCDGVYPVIQVACDDDIRETVTLMNKDLSESCLIGLYDRYLTGNIAPFIQEEDEDFGDFEDDDPECLLAKDDFIHEREMELQDAAWDFISILAPEAQDCAENFNELLWEIIQYNGEYLYNVHGISVYLPTFKELDDGTELFTEHPFETDKEEDNGSK